MNTTASDTYRDLYHQACDRGNARSFALGWAQGNIKGVILSLESILKTKMPQAEKARAIRQQIADLERLVKEINDPQSLFDKRGRA